MSEPKLERIIIPMKPELVKAIDDVRFAERMPSRSEAIRTLIGEALAARTAK
jgi:metal-responsive CopG/Arc/MetJ family transcriptional regulator